MAVITLGPKSREDENLRRQRHGFYSPRAGFNANAVCIPNAEVMPMKTKKSASGRRPVDAELLNLSVTAKMTKTRMNVPRNSSKKALADGR